MKRQNLFIVNFLVMVNFWTASRKQSAGHRFIRGRCLSSGKEKIIL